MKPLLLSGVLLLPAAFLSARSPWQSKTIGVILVSESGGGDWDRFVADARKSLGKTIPLQSHTGSLGARELQRGVDRLQAEKVLKIVVVPVFLETVSPETAQLRYLFGAEQHPSKEFLEKWNIPAATVKRVKTKVPVVITDGMDGHDSVGRTLLERALEMSRDPKNEAVFLVGAGAAHDGDNEILLARLESLAGNVAVRGGFKSASALLIRPDTQKKPLQYENSIRAMRDAIRKKSERSKVIAVPYLLVDDGSARGWRKRLDNLFLRWNGKTLLPSDPMHAWLKTRLDAARTVEGMVKYKDDGQPLPSAKPKSRINP